MERPFALPVLQLDDWMEAFEKQEEEAKAAAMAAADDGWTVVTRKPVSPLFLLRVRPKGTATDRCQGCWLMLISTVRFRQHQHAGEEENNRSCQLNSSGRHLTGCCRGACGEEACECFSRCMRCCLLEMPQNRPCSATNKRGHKAGQAAGKLLQASETGQAESRCFICPSAHSLRISHLVCPS